MAFVYDPSCPTSVCDSETGAVVSYGPGPKDNEFTLLFRFTYRDVDFVFDVVVPSEPCLNAKGEQAFCSPCVFVLEDSIRKLGSRWGEDKTNPFLTPEQKEDAKRQICLGVAEIIAAKEKRAGNQQNVVVTYEASLESFARHHPEKSSARLRQLFGITHT